MKRAVFLIVLALAFPALFCGRVSGESSSGLTFLHYWSGPFSGGIDAMMDTFSRANPAYRVKAQGFEHESYKVGIRVMLASGTVPDLFSYWAGARVQHLVDQGYLEPLDDVWEDGKLDAVFPENIAKACTYDGHRCAVPVTQHFVALFYNRELFRAHGMVPPRSWEELKAVCARFRKAGITPLALGARERWPAQFWFDYLLLRTAGPDFRRDLMRGTAAYDDTRVLRAFSLWADLLEKGYFNDDALQLDWAEAATRLRTGKAAMTLMGSWIIGLFDGQLGWRQSEDYGVFRFPVVDGDEPQVAVGPVDVIVVPARGRVKAAKKVVAYFAEAGPQLAMSRGSGALSPSYGVPDTVYGPLQVRLAGMARSAPGWAFNYDLATLPDVADVGLDAFLEFLRAPSEHAAILSRLQLQARARFELAGNAGNRE